MRGSLIFYRTDTGGVSWGYKAPSTHPHGFFEVQGERVQALYNTDGYYDENWVAADIDRETTEEEQQDDDDIGMMW